jgi:hypothetical protein|tara:strand:- start:9242 stop:11569 length:2328 start_codon:yes stop_codon:yes gene_type:complete
MPEHKDLTAASLHDPKTHASSHASGGADPITTFDNLTAALTIKMSSPAVRLIGTEGSAIDTRYVETGGVIKIQKNTGTEGSPTWTDLIVIDGDGDITSIGSISDVDFIKAKGDTPYVRFTGTETNGLDCRWAESAGNLLMQQNTGTEGSPTWTTRLTIPIATGALSSIVLTTPQINDTSADHQYIFGVAELTADRTISLPLLTGDDTFAFLGFAQAWTADQTYNDSVKVTLGTGGDADLYYDGTDVILNVAVVGTGDFVITGGSIELSDSEGVTLGTGKDATIQYDGTDLVISPAAVGTGDVYISGGSLELDDSESLTLGTGKDATILYDGTNVVINPQAVGSGGVSISAGFLSIGSDPADAGAIRLSNADKIMWEASAAGTDIDGIHVDASEVVQIGASGASGVTITPAVTLGTDLAVTEGGTGASSAGSARTNLGVAIGSDVQAFGAVLDDFNTLGAAASDGEIIVATGAGAFAYESGATARTSLGVAIGSDVQAFGAVLDDFNTLGAAASDGQIIVATGAGAFAYESGATARTSLGLAIGTDVQAYDAQLADIAGLAVTDGNIIVGDGANWVAESGATARTSLGLAIGTDVQAFDAILADLAALSITQGDILYANASDYVALGAGTSGQFLKTQGAAANPIWADVSVGKCILGGFGNPGAGDTQYGSHISIDIATDKAKTRTEMPYAGTAKNMYVRAGTAPASGETIVVTLDKNNSASALTVTISDTATEGNDTANSVAFSAGDYYYISFAGSNNGSYAGQNVTCAFEYEAS